MEGYVVKIKESSRQFDAKERLAIKDTTNAEKFDSLVDSDKSININPADWAVLEVTNPNSENKMYYIYMIIDRNGDKYYTSSPSFWSSFMNIFDEMEGEDFTIEVYKAPSKKYPGKSFLACSIS